MRATSWLPARCSYACLLAVVVLVAFPLGSAGAPDEVADRIQRITLVVQGLQLGVPAVTTSGATGQPLTSAKLVAKAPPALAPGATRAGVVVAIWNRVPGGRPNIAQGVFEERAKEVLCQQDRQAGSPCKTDPGAPAVTNYAEDNTVPYEQTFALRRGEMKKLRDGSKAVVAVTAEWTPWIRLTKGGGNPFPAAVGYAAGTCGDAYVEAFKRKVSDKAMNGFASEDAWRSWVRQQNLTLKDDVLRLLETLTDSLAAAGVCAAGGELAFSDIYPSMVIQAVQDPQGQVRLVAGKSGVVLVTPILRGKNTPLDGVKITVRAVPQNGQGYALAPLGPQSDTARVFPEESPDLNRGDLSQSGIFILPPEKAIEGQLRLEIEATAHSGSGLSNTSVKQTLRLVFQRGAALSVAYVPVCYVNETQCPGPRISGAQEFMSKIYPVADKGGIRCELLPTKFRLDPWPKSWSLTDPNPDTVASHLRLFKLELQKFYNTILGAKPDQLVAWLPAIPELSVLGQPDAVFLGGQGRVAWVQDTSQSSGRGDADWQHLLAHEIGHNLGLRHTGTTDRERTPGECVSPAVPRPRQTGALKPEETDWPNISGSIAGFAFDPQLKERRLKPVDSTYDVMTYCSPPRSAVWISPFHYKKLFDGALQPRGRAPGGRTTAALAAPERALRWAWRSWQPAPVYGAESSEFLIVSGIASRDGRRVQLDPVYRVPDTGPGTPHNPSGNYCLRLTGGVREEQFCFVLTFLDHQMHAAPEQGFSVKVPFPPGTSRVSLLRDGRELTAVTSGAAAPSISIQGVGGGQTLRGRTTMTWAGGTGDRNGVTYVVLYTPNGGRTWYPLAIDATDSRLSFDTADLASSDRAMFRVLSSRGLSTTVAEAGPVKIIGRAPGAVHVALPSTGAARYVALAQSLLWAVAAVWLIFTRRVAPRGT